MRTFRQCYYDLFARFYDRFVELHSSDRPGDLRAYLCRKTGLRPGDRALDICTGTGTLLGYLMERVGDRGLVVGVDFSAGMLRVSTQKIKAPQVYRIQADVRALPFKPGTFDAVTCAHAFYEVKGESQGRFLEGVRELLRPGRPFLMMEHEVPEIPLIRVLFYLRLLSMGPARALEILKHEAELLGAHFPSVRKIPTPTGRSKIWICTTGFADDGGR